MASSRALVISMLTTAAAGTDCTFASSYPRQYVAYRSATPPTFDGKLNEPFWTDVPFTEPFVDISTNSTPGKLTQAKIRYDDQFLYIGGYVQEDAIWANISSTCHCNTTTQDQVSESCPCPGVRGPSPAPGNRLLQVIFDDNDFETFIDADGSTHYYKETEIKAAAASWDLLLNKPYDDGGFENSSRVQGTQGFDMWHNVPPARVSTFVTGTLNDPTTTHTYWTAEIALPLNKLIYNTTATAPPAAGDFWRINFSRVEWGVKVVDTATGPAYWKEPSCTTCPVPGTAVEDNWVWSPQGSIAMHLPERWGFLQFADGPVNGTAPVHNTQWPVRSVAMALYYAQHAYFSNSTAGNGTFTADVSALYPFTPDPHVLDGTCSHGAPIVALGPNATTFSASVSSLDATWTASIRNDRLLLVSAA